MVLLALAQFVMVLDSSVMNVAISQIVDDLDTTIQGVQTAITLYTLVVAAFMLLGAKLADILGRDRAFAIRPGEADPAGPGRRAVATPRHRRRRPVVGRAGARGPRSRGPGGEHQAASGSRSNARTTS